jgi:2-polyprenyl-3-methyl-5-hydroxy-6-metoxy-1,4-benzoquinol methylase
VAKWYDDYLQDEDNYQNKVILPNLLRLLDLDNLPNKSNILDIGCGQGFFIEKIVKESKDLWKGDSKSLLCEVALIMLDQVTQ